MDAAELLRQAGRIVQEAGARLEDRNLASQVHAKGPTDFVTAVDTEVQEQIRARLQALDGTIQFMAEEKDNAAIDPSRPVWILDPVDGTTNLIHGTERSSSWPKKRTTPPSIRPARSGSWTRWTAPPI